MIPTVAPTQNPLEVAATAEDGSAPLGNEGNPTRISNEAVVELVPRPRVC